VNTIIWKNLAGEVTMNLIKIICLGVFFCASAGFAANGVNLIGVSPASIALGGTGVANFTNGTDALYKNPSLLIDTKGGPGHVTVEAFGSFYRENYSAMLNTSGQTSNNSGRVIPDVSATYIPCEHLAVGLGLISYAGGGTDYSTVDAFYDLQSNFMSIRVLPSVALEVAPWFSLGASFIVGYSQLAINEGLSSLLTTGTSYVSTRNPHGDIALGYQIGGRFKVLDNLRFGATYISRTSFQYADLIPLDSFGPAAINGTITRSNPPTLSRVQIQQPEEVAVGGSYDPIPEVTVTFDWRNIRWGYADGYREFGWQAQNVFAMGAEYRWNDWAFRLGGQLAGSPIPDVSGENGAQQVNLQGHLIFAQSVSFFDMYAFPAITRNHITVGSGYKISENVHIDTSFLYAFQNTVTRSGTGVSGAAYSASATASHWSLSAGGTVLF
jgi:long-chain fatty acid transport protein